MKNLKGLLVITAMMTLMTSVVSQNAIMKTLQANVVNYRCDSSIDFVGTILKRNGKVIATTDIATTISNGLMSAGDKTKLDGLMNYVHPSSHPATMITQDEYNRFVTDVEKLYWNNKQPAGNYLTSYTETDPTVPAWAKNSTKPSYTQDEITDGSTNKSFTSIEKQKLSGIAENANNYTHPTGDGNLHIPANGTTNNGSLLQAGATAGSYQWVVASPSLVGLGNVTNESKATMFTNSIFTGTVTVKGTKLQVSDVDTNATGKSAIITGRNYTNTEEDVLFLRQASTDTSNVLNWGGSDASYNSATEHRFWAGSYNQTTGVIIVRIIGNGMGVGVYPTAVLHVKAGTASPGTASLKINLGVKNSVPEAGAIEPTTDGIYWTDNTLTRYMFNMSELTKIREGTNASMGTAVLSSGTIVVSTTKVTVNSRIFLTVQSLGTVTTPKAIAVTARVAGTSFTITSSDVTDTSSVAWYIIEPL